MSEGDLKRLAAKAGLALLFAPRYYAFLTERVEPGDGRSDPSHWQVPLPEPVKVPPAIGMNLKS
jgi:hypothetical protein